MCPFLWRLFSNFLAKMNGSILKLHFFFKYQSIFSFLLGECITKKNCYLFE